ncbi:hypothetical protein L210DRAFT_3153707 [Boletus edulis BED1]|uniref:GBD/FH3 domain-containing protein n=1 Tax=Boletus edulis BED1 TaxID=1328754 RepID=A0AAD4GGJ2_BOLED|nr:hypothetical protein L210DRAFT_3153707 [Boletus edulis BED1]
MTTNDLQDPLTVPVLLLDGSLQSPSISPDTTAQDLIETLIQLDEVKRTVLDVVAPSDWTLRRVRKEKPGRLWDETELATLGDDILVEPTSLVAPLLNKSGSDSANTSAFPLTSRPRGPVLRLVARYPLHSLSLVFLRIPEIDDGFEWTVFFGKGATVEDVINNVVQELGLLRMLPSSRGGGQIEYALEALSGNQATQLSGSTLMVDRLKSFEHPPSFRFCVPDQWFRRKPRSTSTQSRSTTDSSAEEGESTAKQSKLSAGSSMAFQTAPIPGSPEWRGSVAQSRLTSLLACWSQPAPAATSAVVATPTGSRKSVSEPLLVQQNTGGSFSTEEIVNSSDFDLEEFERCITLVDVKGEARAKMHSLPLEKKRQFIEQVQGGFGKTTSPSLLHSSSSATYGPSTGSALLPQFVPQLSGDSGFFKRFSAFPTWSSTTSPPSLSVSTKGRSSGEFATGPRFSASSDKVEDDKHVQPQATGSMFSTWWAALGGETAIDNEHPTSARAYVDGIRRSRNADTKLAKHLISLRVHLSTAKIPWIETFIAEEGIIAISGLLSSLVGKGGKRKALTDSENSVLLEVIRSLRVLLNTEPGFDAVLLSPTIVTHIAYSLHGSSLKIRTLAAEILAGICILSFDEGHPAVLAALSEYRIAYNELFRFQSFVSALKIPDSDVDSIIPGVTFSTEEEGLWEARTAFMALVNALTNCPHTLEERIMLRDEFSRRGLNETVAALRYIKPPDSLLKQLDMYTEEKYDDEEHFRERARRAVRDSRIRSMEAPESSILLEEIMQTARLLEAGDAVESILRRLNGILQGVSDLSFKSGILSVMDEFVGGIATMEDSDQAWTTYLQTLVASVQRLCGRKLPVGNTKMLEEEAQGLRKQLEVLTRETGSGHLHRQGGSVIYAGDKPSPASAPAPAPSPKKGSPSPKPGNEMTNGLMQRLTQKEKEVTQLKGEIDRLKIQNSGDSNDPDDRARKERDKANLNALSEEVTTLKEKIDEMDNALSNKDKVIANMKRAFESVYSRIYGKDDEKPADMGAQLIASHTLDKLSEREQEVVALRAEVQVLKQSLTGRSKEREFKANNPPPPPPSADRRKVTVSKGNKIEPPTTTDSVEYSEQHSPSPLPPPRRRRRRLPQVMLCNLCPSPRGMRRHWFYCHPIYPLPRPYLCRHL